MPSGLRGHVGRGAIASGPQGHPSCIKLPPAESFLAALSESQRVPKPIYMPFLAVRIASPLPRCTSNHAPRALPIKYAISKVVLPLGGSRLRGINSRLRCIGPRLRGIFRRVLRGRRRPHPFPCAFAPSARGLQTAARGLVASTRCLNGSSNSWQCRSLLTFLDSFAKQIADAQAA